MDAMILLMAEIRRSPVEVDSLSHYFHSFVHTRCGCLGCVFHQLYQPQPWAAYNARCTQPFAGLASSATRAQKTDW